MNTALQNAITYYQNGQLNEAQNLLEQLLAEGQKDADIHYYLGCIAFHKDLYDEAITHLEKAIEQDDSKAEYYEMLGEALGLKSQNAGMLKGAMMLGKVKAAFQKALELNPESLSAREGLYMIYLFAPGMAGGDAQKARQMLAEIEERNPARGHIARGMLLMKEKKIGEVEDEFEKAAELGKEDADIQLRVGRFFMERKQFDKARQCLNRYIELKPHDPAGYLALGELFVKLENNDEALKAFNTAVEKGPSNLRARYQRALLFHSLRQDDSAKADLEWIMNQKTKHPFIDKAKKLLKELK
jgi:tetratricopeptide (TPR) repeat protein